ncbi:hypothetical protein [Tunicatimonas pelagia]|nr:hypothetical protein [Tunicatimonas pelagia]WKN42785.1 hypothetical protein P0M28_27495 [Tunicatimonas pelagia]
MAKLTLMPDPRYTDPDKSPLVIRVSHRRKPKYLKNWIYYRNETLG